MSTDLSQLYAFLDRWAEAAPTVAAAALASEAPAVGAQAANAGAYNDQTGATRTGTVAYVPGLTDSAFDRAVASVQQLNGAHVAVESAGSVPSNAAALIITTPTDYAVHLETQYGGRYAYLASTLSAVQARMTQVVAERLAREIL